MQMSTTFSHNGIRYTIVPDDDARFDGVGPGVVLVDLRSNVLRFNRLHLRALVRESEADAMRVKSSRQSNDQQRGHL